LNAVNIVVDRLHPKQRRQERRFCSRRRIGGSINLTSSTISGIGYIQANGGGNGAGGGGGRIAVTTIDSSTLEANNVQALGGFGHYANGANGTVVFIEQSKAALILMGQGASTPWTDLTIPEGYTFDSVTLRVQRSRNRPRRSQRDREAGGYGQFHPYAGCAEHSRPRH
jgi:hypothetical protein